MGAHTSDFGDPVVLDGIAPHPLRVQQTITTWTGHNGLSFDIYVVLDSDVNAEGEWVLVTEDESLDDPPDTDRLRELVTTWYEDREDA